MNTPNPPRPNRPRPSGQPHPDRVSAPPASRTSAEIRRRKAAARRRRQRTILIHRLIVAAVGLLVIILLIWGISALIGGKEDDPRETGQTASASGGSTTSDEATPATEPENSPAGSTSAETAPPEPEHTIEEIDGITYIDGVMIANKTYSLPADFAPGVQPEAEAALNEMIAAAAKDNISLYQISAYRSFSYQTTLYQNYVDKSSPDEADTYSARPGHSEHQTGYAFDLNSLSTDWANTPEGKWLAEHCAEYGFIIRYPADKEAITGYIYEPWHIRWLGKALAAEVTASGLCLEEYFGITSVYAHTYDEFTAALAQNDN